MVLLSMSCPCSWGLVPDGGVATVIPYFLDLHWLAHLKIIEMGPFFGKDLPSYTFLCEMVLLLMSCSCSWGLGKLFFFFTFMCFGFSIGRRYCLRNRLYLRRSTSQSLFLYLLVVLLNEFLTFQIWVGTPQDLRKYFFSFSSYMFLSHLALLSMSCPWWSRPPLWTRGSCATICRNNQPVHCTVLSTVNTVHLISKSLGQWIDASCNKPGL